MHPLVPMLVLAAVGFTGYHVYAYIGMLAKDTRVMTRNFYGTLRVKDIGAETSRDAVRRLMHGVIMHGEQYLAPARRGEPTTYYGATSGVGRADQGARAASPAPRGRRRARHRHARRVRPPGRRLPLLRDQSAGRD